MASVGSRRSLEAALLAGPSSSRMGGLLMGAIWFLPIARWSQRLCRDALPTDHKDDLLGISSFRHVHQTWPLSSKSSGCDGRERDLTHWQSVRAL